MLKRFPRMHASNECSYSNYQKNNGKSFKSPSVYKVRWLSREEVLKCFVVCLKEVKTFLDSKGLNYSQLEQAEWLEKLHFIVDMTVHLNTLNTALQGRGHTALHMLEDVLAFERKFTVYARDLQRGTLSHLPCFAICNHSNAKLIWDTLL